jgi:hypothetical protein
MMYATLLAQAAIVASLALFSGPASTADSVRHPYIDAAGMPAAYGKARLHCRLYFGCAPASSLTVDSLQD